MVMMNTSLHNNNDGAQWCAVIMIAAFMMVICARTHDDLTLSEHQL